jgi:hypothetical protein
VVSSPSSFGKAYLLAPPLSPLRLLPQCDPQRRDVPINILPESLASSPGACQIGCLEWRASPVALSSSSHKANLPVPLSYVSRMIPTLVWLSKQGCSWWHTTWVSCKFTRCMPNRMPWTKAIISGVVTVIVQQSISSGASIVSITITTTVWPLKQGCA